MSQKLDLLKEEKEKINEKNRIKALQEAIDKEKLKTLKLKIEKSPNLSLVPSLI